jgi:hypothetical protein
MLDWRPEVLLRVEKDVDCWVFLEGSLHVMMLLDDCCELAGVQAGYGQTRPTPTFGTALRMRSVGRV